jgi:broad specificity phosphatase PhoE
MTTLRKDTTILYLIRHGATENNLADPPILQGNSVDSPLSAAGRLQAARVTELLAEHEIAAVYSSSMQRAKETAEIIAEPHGLTVTSFDELREVNVGTWEGRSWVEIAQSEPETYKLFMDDASMHGYAGGENLNQVRQRSAAVIERLMQENRGRRIVVVAHNVVNRVFLAPLMYRPMAHARTISQENCCVNVVRLRGDELKLITLNAAFHLEGVYS